jgi:hypothetical protein
MKISDSIASRIALIKSADTEEDLKKHLCPFFQKGNFPDCITCKQTMEDLEECKDVYLENIKTHPMDIWSEEFDIVAIIKRDTKISMNDLGMGINCNTCYIFDKCPMYRKDHECVIDWGENRPKDATGMIDFMTKLQYERVQRASLYEKLDGGVPDVGLSSEIDRLLGLVGMKIDSEREKFSLNVTATGRASDTGGGILAKIFGGSSKPAIEESKPIEIEEVADSRKDIGEVTDFEEIPEKVKVSRKSRRNETD